MAGITGDRATERASEVSRRAAIALLILAPAFTAGVRIVQGGLPALMYDECEYARQMLETADQLFRRGLFVWPEVIAFHQGYFKPPLLVDVAAGFLLLLGRTHAVWAIAATMAATTALTSLVVFRLVHALFSVRTAVFALLALGAIPASSLYSSRFFPEPLVTLLLFLLLAQLFAPSRRAPAWRALGLGLTIGAGLLAKATFPALAAGPILVSWLRSRSGRPGAAAVERGVVLAAVAIGLVVAAVWYAGNLGAAVSYARDSYGFATWSPASASAIAAAWIRAVSLGALGLGGCAAVLAAVAFAALDRATREPGAGGVWGALSTPQRHFLCALFAAAIPSLLAALPSPNVSTRLLLPAFAALGVGASLLVAEARPSGAVRAARAAVLGLVALQWLAVQSGALSPSPAWVQAGPIRYAARWLDPYQGPLEHIATGPLEQLLHATIDLAPRAKLSRDRAKPVLFFVDNYPELDLSRFALYQVARESTVRTRWLCYFNWPDEERAAALERARRGRSIVVSYRPERPVLPDLEFLNRHSDECLAAIRDPASGFHMVRDLTPKGASYSLELYANFELPGE